MWLLDTNVVSELMRATPEQTVGAWADSQQVETMYVSAISQAEIRLGIAFLPDGRRKNLIGAAADRVFEYYFMDRILPFDHWAAEQYATIASQRRGAGRPISVLDCQIAAIARSNRASVVTRNVTDFNGCGIKVFSPWPPRL